MKATLFCQALLILSGCAKPPEQYAGRLVYAHEARTIGLCDEEQSYWLQAEGSLHQRLQTDYLNLIDENYQQIYLEFSGRPAESVAEFAADYAGTLQLETIETLSAQIPADCGGETSADWTLHPATPAARTYVFRCDNELTFTSRTDRQSVWLFLPTGTLQLPRTATEHYAKGGTEFQLVGEQARLKTAERELQCSNDRRAAIWEHAKLNGADFRAIGNEPGWNLEIRQQSELILISEYGAKRQAFELPQPIIDSANGTTRYQIEQPESLRLTIRGENCRDSMSGEPFESQVEIEFDGKTLQGCGKALH